ncbi:hypothetical protein [Dactylosporangium sp. NPDC006015]|uniref:hypothetical protein n=1 Tax=unclassified Dactylosporangium TaxID=2621675 RepID=UPI0033B5DDAE
MTIVELPEAPLHAVRLDPHERPVLGPGDPPAPRTGRLAVGLPVVLPLTVDTVDEQTRPFLRARTGSTFHLLTITTSFTHDDGEPFESAWVDISLRRDGGAAGEPPVAWSMRPRTAAEPVPVSRKVTLSPTLKLGVPGANLEAGAGGGTERQVTYTRQDVTLEALNEGTSDPRWVFYRTDALQIRGVHTLCLVADIAAGARGTASIQIGATIRSRRLKVFRYTAAVTDVPAAASVAFG